jgi:hypothetical protein
VNVYLPSKKVIINYNRAFLCKVLKKQLKIEVMKLNSTFYLFSSYGIDDKMVTQYDAVLILMNSLNKEFSSTTVKTLSNMASEETMKIE